VLIALQKIKKAIKTVFEERISFDRHLLLLAIGAKQQRAPSDFNASRDD
jgi:hypothetical protein